MKLLVRYFNTESWCAKLYLDSTLNECISICLKECIWKSKAAAVEY